MLAGALSSVEILTSLYFNLFNIDPAQSKMGVSATASSYQRAINALYFMPLLLNADFFDSTIST
jgi:transketolase N-terminal domain/subunit